VPNMQPAFSTVESPLTTASELAAPAKGVASACQIQTPPTVTAVVIHKTRSILFIFDSTNLAPDGSLNSPLLYLKHA
jgi:hypothetical protein